MDMPRDLTHCYIDESVQSDSGFVATAFVFGGPAFELEAERVLRKAGLCPREDELKSSTRMDLDPRMRAARDAALHLAGSGWGLFGGRVLSPAPVAGLMCETWN
jgi:hypothetical protein